MFESDQRNIQEHVQLFLSLAPPLSLKCHEFLGGASVPSVKLAGVSADAAQKLPRPSCQRGQVYSSQAP
jgi:hypothetical protein